MNDLKKKILEKMKQPTLASFATITEGKPWARYVMVCADDNMDIWFATFKSARKAAQVKINPEVHLTLGVTDVETAESYIQVQGKAVILDDPETKNAVWYDHLGQIFSGPDDPNYIVCKVTPYRIEYNTMDPSMTPEIWEAATQ